MILALGPVSGAHLNPAVTLTAGLPAREASVYVAAQIGGALIGVLVANAMFGEPFLALSAHARAGLPLVLSEFVATFGLLLVIGSCPRSAIAYAVAAYITAASRRCGK